MISLRTGLSGVSHSMSRGPQWGLVPIWHPHRERLTYVKISAPSIMGRLVTASFPHTARHKATPATQLGQAPRFASPSGSSTRTTLPLPSPVGAFQGATISLGPMRGRNPQDQCLEPTSQATPASCPSAAPGVERIPGLCALMRACFLSTAHQHRPSGSPE